MERKVKPRRKGEHKEKPRKPRRKDWTSRGSQYGLNADSKRARAKTQRQANKALVRDSL